MSNNQEYTYKYPRASLTVDCVIFGISSNNAINVLLVQRKNPPFQDCWAFCGGFVDMNETTEQSAIRELKEETSLCNINLTQFHCFSSLDRDPRGRTITIAYYAVVDFEKVKDKVRADDDAKQCQWFNINSLPALAFDHEQILKKAIDVISMTRDRITIEKGDITKYDYDAIVNAANCSLLGGGGVDGAIHRAAGKGLYQECLTLNGCQTGQAKITKGYNLPSKYVIHTPGPIYRNGNNNEDELLASCYRNCLLLAEQNNIKTICFPSISTGVYHFPLQKASLIAIKTIKQCLISMPTIEKVTMVCFDDNTLNYYEQALNEQ